MSNVYIEEIESSISEIQKIKQEEISKPTFDQSRVRQLEVAITTMKAHINWMESNIVGETGVEDPLVIVGQTVSVGQTVRDAQQQDASQS